MENQIKELRDYIDAFRQRRSSILMTGAALFTISLAVALLWPPAYRSTATILIEEQEIPTDLVRAMITTYATQRIESIKQRVMTRANLMQIIEKYDLYRDKRRRETTEDILDRMRKDIKVETLSADVVDPRSGRPTQATIAFTVAYDGESPEVTQRVANELTSLYLNENLKTRTEKVAQTTEFITMESEKLAQHIAEVESGLADFKKKHAESLPELSQFNMQLIDRTERDLLEIDNQLRSQEDRKFYLEGQLGSINPMSPLVSDSGERVMDPETKLKALRTEYISASSNYSPDHPDVIRLRREIEGLEKQTGAVDSTIELAKELSRQRAELAAAREKYSADHPDVVRLTKAIAAQEEALKKKQTLAPEKSAAAAKPDNPAYVNFKAQIEGADAAIRSLIIKRDELKAMRAGYEKRFVKMPEVEREYLTLKRDYENSVRRYQETKAKQMEAEVGQELEKERKGERFSLIDPPQLPEEPVKPNRPVIIILGFLLSMASGVGYVAVAESMDSSVRGARSVTALLSEPPLSVIPYMKNSEDLAHAEKMKKRVVAAFAGGLVLVVLLIHFFWTPLDILWFRGLRKIGTVIGG
jgi:succinoglycan biosynthesis transport protein ExoP